MREFRIVFAAFLTGVASGAVLGVLMKSSPGEADKKKLEKEFQLLSRQFNDEIESKYRDTVAQLEEVKRSAAKQIRDNRAKKN